MARTPPRAGGTPDPEERGASAAAPTEVTSEAAATPTAPVIAKGTRNDVAAAAARAHRDLVGDDDVASLVHDIRTPLSIILLEADLLARELGGTREAPHRGLERIAQNALYIDRLVADVLDLCSLEAGRLELRLEQVDLVRIVRATVGRAVSTLDRPRVRIEIAEILCARADAARLERVVANLIANALKFSASGEPVTVRVSRHGDQARVAVIDRGLGMTPRQIATVFERYERAGRDAHDGYGLGLHICRQIIEAHGGRIGVTSSPGNGAEFYFDLLAL